MSNDQRLYRAMRILTGPGELRERLAEAFRSELQDIDLGPLSEAARAQLEILRDELTKAEASGERDAIDMSAAELGEHEADGLALQVLEVYDEVLRTGSGPPPHA